METRSSLKRKIENNMILSNTNQRNVKEFTITDDEDFYIEIKKILKISTIGDKIMYLTKNQLGVKTYEVIINKNKKNIKQIGDYEGLFTDPDHPDYILYN